MPLTPEDSPTGGFTTALEDALLAGNIDIAVHSLKDLPTQSHQDLVIASIPQRGPVHDVILARSAEFADAIRLALDEGNAQASPSTLAQAAQDVPGRRSDSLGVPLFRFEAMCPRGFPS